MLEHIDLGLGEAPKKLVEEVIKPLEISERILFLVKEEYRTVEKWIKLHPFLCVYCGTDADTKDHLIPRTWSGESVRKIVPTVPCCRDCNSRLQDIPLFTIYERALFVADKLKKKFKKQLTIQDRSALEMSKFEHKMKDYIEGKQLARQFLRLRLVRLEVGGAALIER